MLLLLARRTASGLGEIRARGGEREREQRDDSLQRVAGRRAAIIITVNTRANGADGITTAILARKCGTFFD